LLLFVLLKLDGRRAVLWGIAAISAVSFAMALFGQAIGTGVELENPFPVNAWNVGVTAFYLLPTRAWELGVGAGIALLREPGLRSGTRTLLTAAALALLGASLALLDTARSAPLPPALFACVATALLVWTGGPDNPVSRLIGARPLAAVGLVSYSLYLWHW